MNVTFVVPSYPNRIKEYLILPNLELTIMSRILKDAGHNVSMIDLKIDGLSNEYAIDKILKDEPDLICIDDIPETHCNTKIIINEVYKKSNRKIKICLMGELASFEPQMMFERNEGLDFLIRYDDDYALLNIINLLEKNMNNKLSNVNNIGFRDGKNIIITKLQQNNYTLDSLPMPDRKIYDIDKYLKRDSETIVKSCRGCPGHCLFCIKTRMRKFKLFSMSRFCDEIQELQNYGFKTFFFADDTFAFSQERLNEFAEELKKRNMKVVWTSNIRIKDITEERIKLMKQLGAYRVFVGIESINEDTQDIINKKLKIEEIKSKIEILKKYNMQIHASFILGNPGDTEETLKNTIKFVKEIKPNIVTFNQIKVYPGLDLYDNPEKYGIILEDKYWFEKDEWSHKTVAGTNNLPPELIEKWSKRLLFEFIN